MALVNTPDINPYKSPIQLLQNRVNWAVASTPATVGNQGKYTTIQDAIANGEYNIRITAPLTVTEDIDISDKNYNIFIYLPSRVTLTFQNARVIGTASKLSIIGIGGASTAFTIQVLFQETEALAGPILTLNEFFLHNSSLRYESTVADTTLCTDATTLRMDVFDFDINTIGTTVPAVSSNDIRVSKGRISDGTGGGTNFWMLSCTGEASFVDMVILGSVDVGTPAGAHVLWSAGSSPVIENSIIDGVVIGGSATRKSYTDSAFTDCIFTNTIGGTDMAGDDSIFLNCTITTPALQITITGDRNQFTNSSIVTTGVPPIIVTGTHNKFVACNLGSDAGVITISGTSNTVLNCTPSSTAYAVDIPAGGTTNKIIGNSFTAALTDAGTNTADLGNNP